MAVEDFRTAYPEALEAAEAKLLGCSPKRRGEKVDRPRLAGVGLSGGGIRSATFALGVFQGLARLGLLKHIDYLSTVSGGGYFGSFFGRLFTRDYVRGVEDVEEILTLPGQGSPRRGTDGEQAIKGKIFPWLRENGRFLSPNGAGDLLLGGAVMLRNWVAVQVVLVTLFLFLFQLAQLVRTAAEAGLWSWGGWAGFHDRLHWKLPFDLDLWASPYVVVAVGLLLLWAFPLGWAYWLVRKSARRVLRVQIHPVVGLLAAAVLAAGAIVWTLGRGGDLSSRRLLLLAVSGLLAAGAVLALLCWARAAGQAAGAWRTEQEASPEDGGGDNSGAARSREWIFKDAFARHWLSARLKTALTAMGAVLGFVLIDSLGQTVYTLLVDPDPESSFRAWAAGVGAALVGLAGGARKLAVLLGGKGGEKRPPAWSKALATVAAFAVMLFVLTAIDAASHAVAWRLDAPAYAPKVLGRSPAPPLVKASALEVAPSARGWMVREAASEGGEPSAAGRAQPSEGASGPSPDRAFRAPRHVLTAAVGFALAWLFSYLFGHSWPFLNGSAHLPLYSSRLIRAYLGASNPGRHRDGGRPVTQVIPGDDTPVERYWPTVKSPGAAARGAPLHLINVTINETIDGRSQIEQRDRKGVGMAVGPAGISAGVRHHVVFDLEAEAGQQLAAVEVWPRDGFRMFRYPTDPGTGKARFGGEPLSLGMWLGISGAAFSTGVGARTSLGLSLLTGFANVRLGYWWHATEEWIERLSWPSLVLRGLFPVQCYLLDEFTARFPGSARRHWYLTDGGHFENMGGYELIRRRLPFIVILDAEADSDYTFGGLAGLVRKARLDFGAEIEFLGEDELRAVLDPAVSPYFGSLEMLRRGKWVEERRPTLADREAKRDAPDPVDPSRCSLAHASLARVFYDGSRDAPGSWLLYLKPTVRGDEPLDVLQYHGDNPDFPQQSTADQFFDEAQWESYRRLGEHIATVVFQQPATPTPGKWLPGSFLRP